MTKLGGSVNRLTPDELAAERARYEENGWRFPEGLTHKVRIQIPVDELEDFCAAAKQLRQDRKGMYDRGAEGREAGTRPSVSLYLSGSEMAGNWISLWGRVGQQQQTYRAAVNQAQPASQQQRTAVTRATAQPAQPVWDQPNPATDNFDQEDIPF